MRAELSSLHLQLNATMIYVTHDQVEAMTMANKIVVMKDGKVQQIGKPLDLYNHPANHFVAGFIGSPPMNFLTVKVEDDGGMITLDEGAFKIKPDPGHVEYLKDYVGKEVFFGIRPEDLIYSESGDNGSFPVKVTVVEPLGAYTHLWLTTGTQPMVAVTEPHHEFKVGDSANFVPRMEKARYFEFFDKDDKDDKGDKEKGKAIIPASGK
jgi:multiple sugar transport system ATP-binding protein